MQRDEDEATTVINMSRKLDVPTLLDKDLLRHAFPGSYALLQHLDLVPCFLSVLVLSPSLPFVTLSLCH